MTQTKENRPAGEPSGSQGNSTISTLEATPILPAFTPDMAAARAQGMLLLMVFNPENGRHRRRIYLSLKAAEKAAHRAEERGHIAHVILGRFSAVEVV